MDSTCKLQLHLQNQFLSQHGKVLKLGTYCSDSDVLWESVPGLEVNIEQNDEIPMNMRKQNGGEVLDLDECCSLCV